MNKEKENKMKIIQNISDEVVEKIVAGIMENFPEASATLQCTSWRYNDWIFAFEDSETGKQYQLGKADLLKAFPLIFTAKWPKGCTQPPHGNDWEVWENWLCECDATDFDAFVQLACLGEVIYG